MMILGSSCCYNSDTCIEKMIVELNTKFEISGIESHGNDYTGKFRNDIQKTICKMTKLIMLLCNQVIRNKFQWNSWQLNDNKHIIVIKL
jgi:hypothetical protein